MQCPECKGMDRIEIEIDLKVDDTVKFYSCRLCEARWWEQDGDTIALDEVLSRAARKR